MPISKLRKLLKEGKVTKTLGVHISPAFEPVKNKYILGNTITVGPLKTLNIDKENYLLNLKSSQDYILKTKSFFPNLQAEDLQFHLTGIMAVLKGFTDFVIKRDDSFSNCIQLVGMDSPALTASLAIARYVRKEFFSSI